MGCGASSQPAPPEPAPPPAQPTLEDFDLHGSGSGTESEVDEYDAMEPLEEVRAVLYEGDLIKFVTRANTTADGMRVLRFLRAVGGGLIAFAMGERGSFTRVLAPVMGSPFTYCSAARLPGQEDPEATAPGQWRVNDLRGLYPPGGVNPETAILGVLGRPVTNSWSPLLHGMALKAAKLDAVYLPFEPEELEEFLGKFGLPYHGCGLPAAVGQVMELLGGVLREEAPGAVHLAGRPLRPL